MIEVAFFCFTRQHFCLTGFHKGTEGLPNKACLTRGMPYKGHLLREGHLISDMPYKRHASQGMPYRWKTIFFF